MPTLIILSDVTPNHGTVEHILELYAEDTLDILDTMEETWVVISRELSDLDRISANDRIWYETHEIVQNPSALAVG